MGEVYLAEDTKLGRQVALKVLSRDSANDPDRRARFEREARASPRSTTPASSPFIRSRRTRGPLPHDGAGGWSDALGMHSAGGMTLHQLLKIGIPLTDAIGTAHHGVSRTATSSLPT
jgi:serine/threonine protein kinase